MPCFDLECTECNHFIEDFYLTTTEKPPTECPECHQQTLKKLFPNNVIVRVAFGAQEMQQHLKEEKQKIRKELKTNENLRANLAGNENYHNTLTTASEISKNLKNL